MTIQQVIAWFALGAFVGSLLTLWFTGYLSGKGNQYTGGSNE